MAYKDHRHGFYNDSYQLTKCTLIKEEWWSEDNLNSRLQIKKEDIISSGKSLTGLYSHALGNEQNQTGHYGQYRIFADLNGENLQVKIAQYAHISDPTSEPILVYDTITAGIMANITSLYISVTMSANTMTNARFVVGMKDGRYYLTRCVNAGAKAVLQTQWFWINGVVMEKMPDVGLNTDKGTLYYCDVDWTKPKVSDAVSSSYRFDVKDAYWSLDFDYQGSEIFVSRVYPANDNIDDTGWNGAAAQVQAWCFEHFHRYPELYDKLPDDPDAPFVPGVPSQLLSATGRVTPINVLNSNMSKLQLFDFSWDSLKPRILDVEMDNITDSQNGARALDNLNNSIPAADRVITLSNGNYIKYEGAAEGRTKIRFMMADGTEVFSHTYIHQIGGATTGAYQSKYVFLSFKRYDNANQYDPIYELYQDLTGYTPYRLMLTMNYALVNFNAYEDGDFLPPTGYGESAMFNSLDYFAANPVLVNLWLEDAAGDPDSDESQEEDTPEEGKEMADETIDDASLPSTSALDIGVIAVFNPTTAQMQALTQEMQQTGFLEEVQKLYKNSPLEGIMSCHVVPVNVETSGSDAPHFGNWTFETTMAKVSEQFYTVNFGSIKLEKKFASFLDYSPYTSVQVYLPYIGYRELDVDDVMGKTIGVKYNFDIITGAILAEVTVDGSVHYQYSGSAIMQFPLTASNHNNLISSIVGLVTSGATTIAGLAVGGPGGGALGAAMSVGGAMSLASSAVHTVASSKPEIQHGGSFAMTNGFLSVKTPYLIANRPNVNVPEDFAKYAGRMTNKTKYVYELSGYTEYMSIDVDSVTALDDEKAEIESILKGGFYA